MTVYEVVNWYIEQRKSRWAPRTLEHYEFLMETYCSRDELSAETVELSYNHLISNGKMRTAQQTYKLIRAACRRAKRYRQVREDPTEYIDPVVHDPEMREYWTLEETKAFLRATRGSEYHLMWTLMLGLGLRRGEMCGLRWIDCDLQEGLIQIRNQRYRCKGQLIDGKPKSRTSKRRLYIPASLIDELRARRRKDPWGTYVYDVTPEALRKIFRAECRRAGVDPIPLHGLRHSFGASAVELGYSLRVLQTLMGHASYSVTEKHYAHVTNTANRRAIAGISEAIDSNS